MKWKRLYKIAVSGSRKFGETDLVTQYLDRYIRKKFDSVEDVVIITGHAVGVDAAVELYCMRRGIANLVFHARWTELELPAGPRRNKFMVDLADEVICFWDGSSRGTKNVIDIAKRAGKLKRTLSVRKLRKVLKVKPPIRINIPAKTSHRDGKRMRELIRNADLEELFK